MYIHNDLLDNGVCKVDMIDGGEVETGIGITGEKIVIFHNHVMEDHQ